MKNLSPSQYYQLLENYKAQRENSVVAESNNTEVPSNYETYNSQNEQVWNQKKRTDKRHQIYETFLFEALYETFDLSIVGHSHVYMKPLMRAMVKQYINESGGVYQLLDKMKTKTLFLSEINRIVGKYAEMAIIEADLNNEVEDCISDEIKNSFYDELKSTEIEDITSEIRSRVSDSVSQFITDNNEKKQEIEEIIDNNNKIKQDLAQKINDEDANIDEIKESYDTMANHKISAVKNKKRSILAYFVEGVCKSTMKNQHLFNESSTNGKLDMDKVMDKAGTMYTFLEMLNTTKLEKVDADYLKNVIEDM